MQSTLLDVLSGLFSACCCLNLVFDFQSIYNHPCRPALLARSCWIYNRLGRRSRIEQLHSTTPIQSAAPPVVLFLHYSGAIEYCRAPASTEYCNDEQRQRRRPRWWRRRGRPCPGPRVPRGMCRIAYLIAEPIDLMPIPIRSSTLGVCEELAGDEPLRMQMAAWKEVEDQAGSSSSQGARLPLPWLVACLFICCLRLIIDRFINRNQSINN